MIISEYAKRSNLSVGEVNDLRARIAELEALINSPTVDDFLVGVQREAAHQVERWGSAHDAGKQPLDWFWLLGYLGQKAADAAMRGDIEKAMHHTISSGAMLANWHKALRGSIHMRPGIGPGSAAYLMAQSEDRA